MALTIYDISRKAGVSTATVSRVLNGSEKVRPVTRQKIMDIIKEYDYAPNAFARGMGLGSSRTIGILCADASDLFFANAVNYLERELQSNGYESLLCCTGYNLNIRKNYVDLILSQKIDGLIMIGSNFIGTIEEERQYIKEASAKIPVMLLNTAFTYPNVYSISCDDYTTTYKVTSTMLEAGIRDILYLYNSHFYSGIEKLEGFKAAMEDHHIADYQELVYFYSGNSAHFNEIADFVESIDKKHHGFHGIITANDFLAIGAIKYAQRKGMRIPEELSVIGYDNSVLTGSCTPELSSVDNCLEAQCHQLVETLLGVLAGKEMPQKSLLSGTLIKRGTTSF